MVTFEDANQLEQFTKVVYFDANFSIWTGGYYNASIPAWLWHPDDPIDTSLFCDNTIPCGVDIQGNQQYIYLDGSGCLKASNGNVKRTLVYVGESYYPLTTINIHT